MPGVGGKLPVHRPLAAVPEDGVEEENVSVLPDITEIIVKIVSDIISKN